MPDSEITYRLATEADAEELVGVINRAFEIEKTIFDADRIDLAETLVHFNKGFFLLAVDGERIAGCVYVSARDEKGYFGLLSVEPAYQGRGLGRKLVEDAEEFCRTAGAAFMEIYVVNHRTELPPFYEKLGYRTARIEEVEQKPTALVPYHFIVMEKGLR